MRWGKMEEKVVVQVEEGVWRGLAQVTLGKEASRAASGWGWGKALQADGL